MQLAAQVCLACQCPLASNKAVCQAVLCELMFLVWIFCFVINWALEEYLLYSHSFQLWWSLHTASCTTHLTKTDQASLRKRLVKAITLTVEAVSQKGMPCLTRCSVAAARPLGFLVLRWEGHAHDWYLPVNVLTLTQSSTLCTQGKWDPLFGGSQGKKTPIQRFCQQGRSADRQWQHGTQRKTCRPDRVKLKILPKFVRMNQTARE